LDICLYEAADFGGEDVHLAECFALVSAHRSRIRRLHYWTSTISLDELQEFTRPLPLLEELVLVPPRGRHDDLIWPSWRTDDPRYFQGYSRLRRLDSHVAFMVPAHPLPTLSYLSLSLRGDVEGYDPIWKSLAQTPALDELRLYFAESRWRSVDSGDCQNLSLPHLVRLAVFGAPNHYQWAEKLNAPKLTTLTVSIEWCDINSRLYRALRDRVRHLIITTVETRSGGFLNDSDTIALDELESLSTFELRDIREEMLSSSNQGFFQHLVDRIVESPDGSPWSARVPALILRRCRFSWRACESLIRFVGVRHGASAEHGRPMLGLKLVDTTFVKYGSYKPAGFEDIEHYFSNAQFERVQVTVDQSPEPVDGWGEWSDADDDGGVIGWQIFDRPNSPGPVEEV